MVVMERLHQAFLPTEQEGGVQILDTETRTTTQVDDAYWRQALSDNERFQYLLNLNRPEWRELLTIQGFPPSHIHRLDDMVTHWLSQDDYHRLLTLAREPRPHGSIHDPENLFDLWIERSHADRLMRLIGDPQFQPAPIAGYYAATIAWRAVKSAIDYVQSKTPFSQDEIQALIAHLQNSPEPGGDHLPDGW